MATLAQLRNGELQGIQRLQISEDLSHFPTEIFELADTLEILDLSGNCLSQLPDDLYRLYKLKIIFCSNNQFTKLPIVLGSCPNLTMVGFKSNHIYQIDASALPKNLRWLILTDNKIQKLPEELGQCSKLQKLMLSGNCLTELPQSLNNCKQLELIRIASNQLTSFPSQLLTLPRLAWLAFSDNPFLGETKHEKASCLLIENISWQNIRLGKLLGQGASGHIYEALIDSEINDAKEKVAIKIFKGSMTSDGQPQSEINTTLMAGCHHHLIGVKAQIQDHPEGLPVLVMEQLSSDFAVLASPPSLESCTRDVYAETFQLNSTSCLKIVSAVADTANYLHQKGIMHGDLYAHNILIRPNFDCILSDFGAASSYLSLQTDIRLSLEKIEVKAFGYLLDELMSVLFINSDSTKELIDVLIRRVLQSISERCQHSELQNRPSFAQINEILLSIKQKM